jgi:tRNA threonylcarbamoyladenosine modification (KEOPS) complex  Pcc1 subunit
MFLRDDMSVKCRIEIELPSEDQAESIRRSIELDNGQYATAEVDGSTLILTADAKSMPSMLHTLEDLLACIKVAGDMTALH